MFIFVRNTRASGGRSFSICLFSKFVSGLAECSADRSAQSYKDIITTHKYQTNEMRDSPVVKFKLVKYSSAQQTADSSSRLGD